LENALATDRERQWKAHSGPESESEGTEGRTIITRPRSRKASGVVSRLPKGPRKRGDTVTSSRTAVTRRDSNDTTRSENSSKLEEVKTPTGAENPVKKGDVNTPPTTTTASATTATPNDDAPISEEAAADRRSSTPAHPVTPALTPALTGTTDDSDTDFQSAYSSTPSPRESLRGNFDGRIEGGGAFQAENKHLPGSFEADIVRERVSSVATAVIQPSPTFSDDTVVSRHGGAISRR